MKCHVLHIVRCYISGESAGEVWNWSPFGVEGLSENIPNYYARWRSLHPLYCFLFFFLFCLHNNLFIVHLSPLGGSVKKVFPGNSLALPHANRHAPSKREEKYVTRYHFNPADLAVRTKQLSNHSRLRMASEMSLVKCWPTLRIAYISQKWLCCKLTSRKTKSKAETSLPPIPSNKSSPPPPPPPHPHKYLTTPDCPEWPMYYSVSNDSQGWVTYQ